MDLLFVGFFGVLEYRDLLFDTPFPFIFHAPKLVFFHTNQVQSFTGPEQNYFAGQ